ncbi:unnamed protein product [Malus baccata var. baccata]
METSVACYARGAFPVRNNVSSQHSSSLFSPASISPSFNSKVLRTSSLFGESLQMVPKSSLKVLKTNNTSIVPKCAIGDSLEEFLTKATPDKKLITLLISMGEALRTIGYKVRTASCGGTACVNSFGDEQLAVDMLADKLLFEALTYSHVCKYACSEEVPELQDMGGPVEGKWQHVKETTEIGEGKLFSPGNLRATFDNPDYGKLIDYYLKEKYTLRYTGGMVPDVNQIIVKEKGIFTNVISPTTKAKLRLLFEVAPLGLLVENAGGFSSDGHQSVLDKIVVNLDDRTQVAYGSKNEIIRFEETLYGSSRLKRVPVGAAA